MNAQASLADIDALVAASMTESASLEFKASAALARTDSAKRELVKDSTAMASAGGGRIVYGVRETKVGGLTCAGALDPLQDTTIGADWITQVITSKSSPPLRAFAIQEISLPAARGGGRLVVLDIEAGDTAHQSTLDFLYWQRVGAIATRMLDFQIRDVMNRRSSPIITVNLDRLVKQQSLEAHVFQFVPRISNVGTLSLERWTLEVDLPREACVAAQRHTDLQGAIFTLRAEIDETGRRWTRVIYPSGLVQIRGANADVLHPGQMVTLGSSIGLSAIFLLVDENNYSALEAFHLPVRWRLFMPDAKPLGGELPFREWCQF